MTGYIIAILLPFPLRRPNINIASIINIVVFFFIFFYWMDNTLFCFVMILKERHGSNTYMWLDSFIALHLWIGYILLNAVKHLLILFLLKHGELYNYNNETWNVEFTTSFSKGKAFIFALFTLISVFAQFLEYLDVEGARRIEPKRHTDKDRENGDLDFTIGAVSTIYIYIVYIGKCPAMPRETGTFKVTQRVIWFYSLRLR